MTGKIAGRYHFDATVSGPGDDGTLLRTDGSGTFSAFLDRAQYMMEYPNRPV